MEERQRDPVHHESCLYLRCIAHRNGLGCLAGYQMMDQYTKLKQQAQALEAVVASLKSIQVIFRLLPVPPLMLSLHLVAFPASVRCLYALAIGAGVFCMFRLDVCGVRTLQKKATKMLTANSLQIKEAFEVREIAAANGAAVFVAALLLLLLRCSSLLHAVPLSFWADAGRGLPN